jgi:hypothetical protein
MEHGLCVKDPRQYSGSFPRVVSNGELVVFDHDWRHWWSGAKALNYLRYSCGAPRKVCSLSPYAQV